LSAFLTTMFAIDGICVYFLGVSPVIDATEAASAREAT